MIIKTNKRQRIVIPKGYYKLDKRQKLEPGDQYAAVPCHPYETWDITGQNGDKVADAIAGFGNTYDQVVYIRRVNHKRIRNT